MRAVIVGLLALGGCATVPQTPLLAGVKTIEIQSPVNVRCVALREVPTIPKTRMEAPPSTATKTIADLQRVIERWAIQIDLDFIALEDYVVRADALLRACATEPQPSTVTK